MDLAAWADQISSLPLATAIRTGLSWRWLFPTVESAHVLAIATVFGSILLVDLRLLGLRDTGTRLSKLADELLPITWIAFALAVVTGSLLFIANAPDYVFNIQFRLKMLAILLAGVNMAVFQFGVYRRVAEWDDQSPPPAAARAAGLISLLCWTAVIFLGRWIGFVVL